MGKRKPFWFHTYFSLGLVDGRQERLESQVSIDVWAFRKNTFLPYFSLQRREESIIIIETAKSPHTQPFKIEYTFQLYEITLNIFISLSLWSFNGDILRLKWSLLSLRYFPQIHIQYHRLEKVSLSKIILKVTFIQNAAIYKS